MRAKQDDSDPFIQDAGRGAGHGQLEVRVVIPFRVFDFSADHWVSACETYMVEGIPPRDLETRLR